MKIIDTLYPDELTAFAPDGADPETWVREVYAPALETAYGEEWPEAEVEIVIVPRTTGAGSGVRVTDHDGMALDGVTIDAEAIRNRVLEGLA